MTTIAPTARLDSRFSSRGAGARDWAEARDELKEAELYWLSTVRPDGRPHVTPLIAVWLDDALYFCTGPAERKAKNITTNPQVVLMTGCNSLSEGLDIVLEGEAAAVTNEGKLRRLVDAYVAKYGEDWRFEVRGGRFYNNEGGEALVFEVAPATAFGFAKGEPFSQTRWRF